MEYLETAVAEFATFLELLFEAASVFIVAAGGLVFVVTLIRHRGHESFAEARTTLARCLVIALEVQLAADIVATATNPTWEILGKLAAVAAIRTFLNYFLMVEIRSQRSPD